MVETARFDYHLPAESIALRPADPRHAARLLDARDMEEVPFLRLAERLEPGDLVVVNRTRVRAARLHGHKRGSGGAVEALLLRRLDADRWEALVRPARRLHRGTLVDLGPAEPGSMGTPIEAEVLAEPHDGVTVLALRAGGDIEEAIEAAGTVPLPPYVPGDAAPPERYQTIFADRAGSAAAPTAGLHFTDEVLERLAARDVEVTSVDLEVGLATFRPIGTEEIEDHRMHTERCRVGEAAAARIAACRRRSGRVVAVGTTVVRTLESFAAASGDVEAGERDTDLYLRPGSTFRAVDLLITNFHLPRSSLLVLLEAFMGPGWREVYRIALDRGFRFLSFGDAMLCERA